MTMTRNQAASRLAALAGALGAAALLSACVVDAPPGYYVQAAPRPAPVYEQPAPDYAGYDVPDDDPVVSVYVDPPIEQPEPIAVAWAPPPMLVEVPPPQPYPDAQWTGGYWAWEGRWFWAAGRWAPPPRPRYVWVQPYYEHRADVVVFVPGFWCAPERHFVPPPAGLRISVAIAGPGWRRGRPPRGPQGVFVPPPPGSRAGIIVPAPLGTPPAVVVSAPPVLHVGMRVRGDFNVGSHDVTIEAPAGATADGRAFQDSVPARAPLAAGRAAAGRPAAPRPTSWQAIPTFRPGHPPVPLPAGQPVREDRNEHNDRFHPNDGARPDMPQQPAAPHQPWAPPLPPQGRAWQPPSRPGQGQGRPAFDQPPRTPAPLPGQPQPPDGRGPPPAWQHGPQPAWQQGRQPEWQHGQQPALQQGQQPALQQGQPRPGNGQPPQGQAQRTGPQPGQPPAPDRQDPRHRADSPQGQAGAGKAGDKDERRKPPREGPDDRDKRNGQRER